MRILFAGTPDFSVPVLDVLANSNHELIGVFTQPDRPAGRGRHLQASPVKQRAAALNIPVYQPASLKETSVQAEVAAFQADLMVVVAYGLILPQAVLDMPRLGCINVHASLLPRWRGAAPIQRAILAGDRETGISIMQMEAGLDTGPVLAQRECPIDERDTGGALHDRLAELGAQTLSDALPRIVSETVVAEPQNDSQACYAAKINKAEARLNWQLSAAELSRAVLAWNPWPVAFTYWQGKPVRIWSAETANADALAADAQAGQVSYSPDQGLCVKTGQGVLRLLKLQFAGGKPMTGEEAARGRDLQGIRFE